MEKVSLEADLMSWVEYGVIFVSVSTGRFEQILFKQCVSPASEHSSHLCSVRPQVCLPACST